MFDALFDFFTGVYEKIIDFFDWLSNYLIDFVRDVGYVFLKVVKEFFNWTMSNIEPVFADLADSVPDVNSYMASSRPVFRQALYVCDRMFAISEGIGILTLFLTFVFTFILIKLALKLFPAIG